MGILFKNGTVIDYASKTEDILDILVEDKKIVKVAKDIEVASNEVIDCKGLYIMPGMIDMHCHLREPGGEHKETIETGSKSAVKGGFTSICPMPNTNPTPDSAIVLKQILDRAKEVNLCNIYPFSSVTKGEKGEVLVDFKTQLEAGAIAFSDDRKTS
jgi:dihydroorotase